jgi:hypothetical protein
MKFRLFVITLVLSCTGLNLFGQSQSEDVQWFTLDDGTRVLYQVQTEVNLIDSGLNRSYQNTIERTLRDQGKAWLGFNIHINRTGKDTFQISMEPISGWPFFAEPPAPREIHSGDRVLLDVMEQPSTGRKIFDAFQVGSSGTAMQPMPSGGHTIAQIPQRELTIQLSRATFGVKGKGVTSFSQSTIVATRVGVTVPGLGRFIFTSRPESGSHMEAVAEGTVLDFIAGANRYRIECSAPIVEPPGAWYLWVKFEPSGSQTSGNPGSAERQLIVEGLGKKPNTR